MKNKKKASEKSALYYSILPREPQLFMGHLGSEPKTNMKTVNYPSRYSMSLSDLLSVKEGKTKLPWLQGIRFSKSVNFLLKHFVLITKHVPPFVSNYLKGGSGQSGMSLTRTKENTWPVVEQNELSNSLILMIPSVTYIFAF